MRPACPTKGRPLRSSLRPGASPTNITPDAPLPKPGTALVLPSHSPQRVHVRTSAATSSKDTARRTHPRRIRVQRYSIACPLLSGPCRRTRPQSRCRSSLCGAVTQSSGYTPNRTLCSVCHVAWQGVPQVVFERRVEFFLLFGRSCLHTETILVARQGPARHGEVPNG